MLSAQSRIIHEGRFTVFVALDFESLNQFQLLNRINQYTANNKKLSGHDPDEFIYYLNTSMVDVWFMWARYSSPYVLNPIVGMSENTSP